MQIGNLCLLQAQNLLAIQLKTFPTELVKKMCFKDTIH